MKNPPVYFKKRRTSQQIYQASAAIYFYTGVWVSDPLSFSPHALLILAASSDFSPKKSTHRCLERSLNHHG